MRRGRLPPTLNPFIFITWLKKFKCVIVTRSEHKKIIADIKLELASQKILFDENVEIGIMIETPAAVLMADELARECDFFSIGTNDLIQYTVAADRQNVKVAHLTDEVWAVLRLIDHAAESIHENGGWIGVCGEMAADLRYTQELVSIGVDELSDSTPYLLGIRQKVCDCK